MKPPCERAGAANCARYSSIDIRAILFLLVSVDVIIFVGVNRLSHTTYRSDKLLSNSSDAIFIQHSNKFPYRVQIKKESRSSPFFYCLTISCRSDFGLQPSKMLLKERHQLEQRTKRQLMELWLSMHRQLSTSSMSHLLSDPSIR